MRSQRGGAPDTDAVPASDAAIGEVCTLPPAGFTSRCAELRGLLARAIDFEESELGVVVRFPASDDAARLVCEAVFAERKCCGQFGYLISFPSQGETIKLSIEAVGDLVAPLKALYRGLFAAGNRGE